MGWADEVLSFWFSLRPEQWWTADPELDRSVAERFQDLWEELRQCPAETFLGSAHEALASAILFDQFPRNMFRGSAEQFATDHLALQVAKAAVDRGYDERLPRERRHFLYMPFEHSERSEDQDRSLLLFTALGDPELLHFAKLHRDIVERFGRFPHRNALLGRKPRPDEIAAGSPEPW